MAAVGNAAMAAGMDANLRPELERVVQRRIFFGHQSVGSNLLEGLHQLAEQAGVAIHVAEVSKANAIFPATLGHALIARNGDPVQKIQNFERALGEQAAAIDFALMKFCYVDFNAHTDVKALFGRYQAMLAGLKAKYPGMTFIHVTVPLTTTQRGIKANLKKMMGRAPAGVLENLRRDEYNTLVRQAYLGREPVFDLARLESIAPDGSKAAVEWQGRMVPELAVAYTDDGGHLNEVGKLNAAREFISVLAAARP